MMSILHFKVLKIGRRFAISTGSVGCDADGLESLGFMSHSVLVFEDTFVEDGLGGQSTSHKQLRVYCVHTHYAAAPRFDPQLRAPFRNILPRLVVFVL